MNWQILIHTSLNLNDLSPKVISDYTGILSTRFFLDFLKESNISFLVTDKVPEMLTASKSGVRLIITKRNVPAFVQNNLTHRSFSLADIPLNGEIATLLKNKSTEEIVQLMDFIYYTEPHLVVTRYNVEKLFHQSTVFTYGKQLAALLTKVETLLVGEPDIENLLQLGLLWGEVIFLSAKAQSEEYSRLIPLIDAYSKQFLFSGKMEQVFYASTARSPKTVDRILHHLKSKHEEKLALICFDCMGYAEWHLLKEYLYQQKYTYIETPLFAMLPSVTKFSRSAIFHGSREVYNIKSPGRADEAKAFASFFSDKQTRYFTEGDPIDNDNLIGYDCISILYSFFDDLSHSAQFPPNEETKDLYFKSVRSYLEKTNLVRTLQTLHAHNFAVYFCSDHGSVVAKGNGQRFEKYLLDSFAKRAIIIPEETKELINVELLPVPFHSDISIAFPEGRTMFANKSQIEINHGGITVEEMVVPFIKVEQ